MTRHRAVPLTLAVLGAIAVACDTPTSGQSVPLGYVTISAQKSATGYVTSPVGTFNNVNGVSAPVGVAEWDSCRQQNYAPSATATLTDVFPSLDAGASIAINLPGRTDSLYQVPIGFGWQYKLRVLASVPYTPGDSVRVVVPGTSSGYPAVTFKTKTAEAVTVTDVVAPPSGSRLDLHWTTSPVPNSTMTFTFRYAALNPDTLDTQLICQFRDDGTDTIPARYISPWAASTHKSWAAARLRTYVTPVAKSGYFEFVSTFDVPTPLAP